MPLPPPEEAYIEHETGEALAGGFDGVHAGEDDEIEMEFPADPSREKPKKAAAVLNHPARGGAIPQLDEAQQQTLDKILSRWRKTDEVTPFLVTKYIENRSVLVLQKIVMAIRYTMTQQGGMASSYPNQLSPIPIPEEFGGLDSFI